jgi:CBS domain-containing protein
LAENKILAAPVIDLGGRWLGFVDAVIVLKHARRFYFNESKDDEKSKADKWKQVLSSEMGDVVDKSRGDALVFCSMGSSMRQVLPIIGGGMAHRVLVRDYANKSKNPTQAYKICSQWDFIRAFYNLLQGGSPSGQVTLSVEAAKQIARLMAYDIAVLLDSIRTPILIESKTNLLEGLEKMMDSNVSALGMVNDKGELVGNLSSSDLKGLRFSDKDFSIFEMSITEFLKSYSPLSLEPVTVVSSAKFSDLFELIVEKKIHRIWVVDADKKPTHLISLTDVLRYFNALI